MQTSKADPYMSLLEGVRTLHKKLCNTDDFQRGTRNNKFKWNIFKLMNLLSYNSCNGN